MTQATATQATATQATATQATATQATTTQATATQATTTQATATQATATQIYRILDYLIKIMDINLVRKKKQNYLPLSINTKNHFVSGFQLQT